MINRAISSQTSLRDRRRMAHADLVGEPRSRESGDLSPCVDLQLLNSGSGLEISKACVCVCVSEPHQHHHWQHRNHRKSLGHPIKFMQRQQQRQQRHQTQTTRTRTTTARSSTSTTSARNAGITGPVKFSTAELLPWPLPTCHAIITWSSLRTWLERNPAESWQPPVATCGTHQGAQK